MASAHPEGEVYFQRSSLRFNNNGHIYNAEVAEHFYTHCLIEWVSNEPMGRQSGSAPPNQISNPRSTYITQKGSGVGYNIWFGFWSHLPVSLGPRNAVKRNIRIPLETNVARFKDRDNGAAQTVRLHPCPMPHDDEKWMWIDLIAPIRAIYLPLSQVAEEDFPHLCTYVQVNFYQQGRRSVWRESPNHFFYDHQFSPQLGVGFLNGQTLGINVTECIKLLALPPKLRVTNIWFQKLIVIGQYNWNSGNSHVSQLGTFDFIDFINANFAVDVIWKPVPPRNTFIRDLIGTVISAGLGCVPGVGPLLSAGFSVAWQAVTDPDGFKEWAQSGGWALTVIETVIGSADSMRKYVHPKWQGSYDVNPRLLEGPEAEAAEALSLKEEREEEKREEDWEHVGPSELLLHGLRIIAFSARSSRSRHEGPLHTPILLRAVECGTMSIPEALAVERGLEALPEDDPEGPGEPEEGNLDGPRVEKL